MRKASICFICIFAYIFTFSQINKPEILGTAGDSFKNNTMILDWTIGEAMITTLTNESTQITQGFHQSTIIINDIKELPSGIEALNLFPNPASNHITLQSKFIKEQDIDLDLIAINGERLFSKHVRGFNLNETIDLSTLPSGLYYLSFGIDGLNYSIPFTIQKIN